MKALILLLALLLTAAGVASATSATLRVAVITTGGIFITGDNRFLANASLPSWSPNVSFLAYTFEGRWLRLNSAIWEAKDIMDFAVTP